MITIKQTGDWKKTEEFLKKAKNLQIRSILEKFGSAGISALSKSTPMDSGLTASSWEYVINVTQTGYSIEWRNNNVVNGVNIALLIQYGHGTGTGGYVPPRDYINPAIKPIMDQLAEDIWKEVSSL